MNERGFRWDCNMCQGGIGATLRWEPNDSALATLGRQETKTEEMTTK